MEIMKVGNHKFISGDTNKIMEELVRENQDDVMLYGDEPRNVFDYVLTSPPYNAHRTDFYKGDTYIDDSKTHDEHKDWLVSHFKLYNELLKKNGVVIYNINYMSSLKNNASNLFRIITDIEDRTNFVLIEQICWKKTHGTPSKEARLSRVWENVFIFIRKEDWKTFHQEFKGILVGRPNYIEAPNNDYTQDINKATFSSSMVEQLLRLYGANEESIVLDNFMGTGTTAIGCEKIGCSSVGIELDNLTFNHSIERVKAFIGDFKSLDENNIFNYLEENE